MLSINLLSPFQFLLDVTLLFTGIVLEIIELNLINKGDR